MAKLKMLKQRANLLHGNSQDIINTNITALKDVGHSHAHATHLALKHANKKHASTAKRISVKVVKKSKFMKLKPFGGSDA